MCSLAEFEAGIWNDVAYMWVEAAIHRIIKNSRERSLSYTACSWAGCNKKVTQTSSSSTAKKFLVFSQSTEGGERTSWHSCGQRGTRRQYRFHIALTDFSVQHREQEALPICIVWSIGEKLIGMSAEEFELLSPIAQEQRLNAICDGTWRFKITLNSKQNRFTILEAERPEEFEDAVEDLAKDFADCTFYPAAKPALKGEILRSEVEHEIHRLHRRAISMQNKAVEAEDTLAMIMREMECVVEQQRQLKELAEDLVVMMAKIKEL